MSEQVVRDYWRRVWCEGSADAALELYAEGALMNGEPLDREEFAASVVAWHGKFPGFTATVEDAIVSGDRVVTRVTYRGTHAATWAGLAATGRSFASPGLDVFTVRDGRITEHWHATDHYELIVQLGGKIVPAEAD